MSYVHCHGRERKETCDWGQDDFWSFRYNPVSVFFGYIPMFIKPRFVGMDSGFVSSNSLKHKLGLVRVIEKTIKFDGVMDKQLLPEEKYVPIKVRKTKTYQEHSWSILHRQFIYMLKKFWKMKWWTWESYKHDRLLGLANCPECGNPNLCID